MLYYLFNSRTEAIYQDSLIFKICNLYLYFRKPITPQLFTLADMQVIPIQIAHTSAKNASNMPSVDVTHSFSFIEACVFTSVQLTCQMRTKIIQQRNRAAKWVEICLQTQLGRLQVKSIRLKLRTSQFVCLLQSATGGMLELWLLLPLLIMKFLSICASQFTTSPGGAGPLFGCILFQIKNGNDDRCYYISQILMESYQQNKSKTSNYNHTSGIANNNLSGINNPERRHSGGVQGILSQNGAKFQNFNSVIGQGHTKSVKAGANMTVTSQVKHPAIEKAEEAALQASQVAANVSNFIERQQSNPLNVEQQNMYMMTRRNKHSPVPIRNTTEHVVAIPELPNNHVGSANKRQSSVRGAAEQIMGISKQQLGSVGSFTQSGSNKVGIIGSKDDLHNIPYEMQAKVNKNSSALEMAATNILQTGRAAQSVERQMSYERVQQQEQQSKMPIYWQNNRNSQISAIDNAKRIEDDKQLAIQHRLISKYFYIQEPLRQSQLSSANSRSGF